MLELARDENVPAEYRSKALKLLVNFKEKELIKIRDFILETFYDIIKSNTDPSVRISAIRNFTLIFKVDKKDEKIVSIVRLLEELIFKEKNPDVYIEIINSFGKFKSLINREKADDLVNLFLENCSSINNPASLRISSIKGLSQFSSLVNKPTREKIAETLLELLSQEKNMEITDAIILAFGEIQKYVDVSLRLEIIEKLFELLSQGELKQVARDVSLVIRQTWMFLDPSQRSMFWQKIINLLKQFKDARVKSNLIALFGTEIQGLSDEAILAIIYSLNDIIANPKESKKARLRAASSIRELVGLTSIDLVDNIIEDLSSFIVSTDDTLIRQNLFEAFRKIATKWPEEKGTTILNRMIRLWKEIGEPQELFRTLVMSISEVQHLSSESIDHEIIEFIKKWYDILDDDWLKTLCGTILLRAGQMKSIEEKDTILENLITFLSADENVITRATAAKLIGILIPYWTNEEREILKANLSLRLSIEDSDIVKEELLNTIHLIGQ